MQLKKFSLEETHAFNSFFLDYISQKETLRQFYSRFPIQQNFETQIAEKGRTFPKETRKVLVTRLKEQYNGIQVAHTATGAIESLLEDTTFTVTTGHQLNIFTGPLYFIFKIVTVVNACRQLKKFYPQFNFVPVYWMASEDHDYEEIRYFRLYGQKYVWETNQTGAVGRFSTSGMEEFIDRIPGATDIFRKAYLEQKNLAGAVRQYVNELFGEHGLVVIDADDRELKQVLKPVIRDDVFENSPSSLVNKTNVSLEALGYTTQVHAREINFFYLADQLRARIEKSGDVYKVVDTGLTFTTSEMQGLIEDHPERFSPNVILRPVYQELILPNIAYAGGPAELIYWLQLKQVFAHYDVPFPMLMPRNFGMIIDPEVGRKFSRTGLELKDIFEEKNYLFNHWVLRHSPRNLTVGKEINEAVRLFDQLAARANEVDKSLVPFVRAESKRAVNSLEKIERKFLRAEKRLHADKLRQIESVKDALFPGGSLQERTDNFLNFYQKDAAFIDKLLECFDPFDYRFNVLMT